MIRFQNRTDGMRNEVPSVFPFFAAIGEVPDPGAKIGSPKEDIQDQQYQNAAGQPFLKRSHRPASLPVRRQHGIDAEWPRHAGR